MPYPDRTPPQRPAPIPSDCATAKNSLIYSIDNEQTNFNVRYGWLDAIRTEVCALAQAIADLRLAKPGLVVSTECDDVLRRLCERLGQYEDLVNTQECTALANVYDAIDAIDCNDLAWRDKYLLALNALNSYRGLIAEVDEEFRWGRKTLESYKVGQCQMYFMLGQMKIIPLTSPPPPPGPPAPPSPPQAPAPCGCGSP